MVGGGGCVGGTACVQRGSLNSCTPCLGSAQLIQLSFVPQLSGDAEAHTSQGENHVIDGVEISV